MMSEPTHPSPEDLFAYRDGELSAERRALLEAHVSSCRICRERIDRVSGLEAVLRQRPDPVDEDYYATLSRSVLDRVGAKEPAGAPVPARERRRAEEPEEPRLSRAPGLPWAPIFSTLAAAAAVVVVVVMLFRQGGIERGTLTMGRGAGAPRENAPAESAAGGREGAPGGDLLAARPGEAESKRSEAAPPGARAGKGPSAGAPVTAPAPAPARPEAPAAQTEQLASGSVAETRPPAAQDRAAQLKAAAQLNESAPPAPPAQQRAAKLAKDEAQALSAGRQDAAATGTVSAEAASPYSSLVRRLGLPDLWTEGAVSRGALLKAEPDFRFFYMSGRAGADSARVRLYLAEAARIRYESRPDSALYETIVHHCLRAIRLSAEQPDVARVARQRLESFSR